MLNVNQLANGLGFAFNTKSQNAQQWAQLIGDTIWAYTSVISPPSAGVASGKATFIRGFSLVGCLVIVFNLHLSSNPCLFKLS